MSDPRAKAVLEAAAKKSGWPNRPAPGQAGLKSGRGVAYVRYDRTEAYVAAVVDVEVNPADGQVRVTHSRGRPRLWFDRQS